MKVFSTCPPVQKALFTCLLLLSVTTLFAQNKAAEKANELYKLNQFAQAADLYEQALLEKSGSEKSAVITLNHKTKLAWCYRMNNKMEKAEALYAEIVQDEKAKSETFLFYGEALMSNGKYEEAKKSFLQYQKLQPEDERGNLMAIACDKVPFIQPYFQYTDIQEFAQNSDADDNGPVAWQNGMVFSSDRKSGIKLMKEKSGWTGRDYLDLYFSAKKADGSFSEPEQFSGKLSEMNKNTGNASFTADGSEVYFTRNDNVLNKQETYNLQLFRAQSSGSERWRSVEKLPFCNPSYNFMHPAISPDGQWLFFASNKGSGQGGTDLWSAKRNPDSNRDGGWEKPENLGAVINTSVNEGFPFLDAEGRLYFCSKGHPGFGGFDIFVSEKDENGNWSEPRNLGKPINTSLDDISIFVAPDRRSGMFTSSRNGGDDDVFLFQVLDSAPLVKTPEVKIEENLPEKTTAKTEPAPLENLPEKEGVVKTEPAATKALPEKTTAKTEPAPVENLPNKEIAAEVEPSAKEPLPEKAPAKTPLKNSPKKKIPTETKPELTEHLQKKSPAKKKTTPPENSPKKKMATETKPELEELMTQNTPTDLPEKKPLEPQAETIVETKIPESKPLEISEKAPEKPAVEIVQLFITPEPEKQPETPEPLPEKTSEPAIVERQIENMPSEKSTIAENGKEQFELESEAKIVEIQPISADTTQTQGDTEAPQTLLSFKDFEQKAAQNSLSISERFRLDNAVFDANIWQLTPPVSNALNQLAEVLRKNTWMQVEIAGHTEALGIDEENLKLSQNRADMAMDYLIREGISKTRLSARGYGELLPLNHCRNGVTCSLDEHLYNQRLEIKIVGFNDKQ